ncbi:MAG: hypothetical protein JO007_03965 [Alphaproteobacteria bacterium]|nr:hypothetical protein [Alphaproteobacteria bacterium]
MKVVGLIKAVVLQIVGFNGAIALKLVGFIEAVLLKLARILSGIGVILLELVRVLTGVRMVRFELVGVLLELRMALLEGIGMIGECARVVDTAIAPAPKPGIGAAVGKAAVPKARRATKSAAMKTTETTASEAAKPATAVKAPAKPERDRMLGPNRNQCCDCCSGDHSKPPSVNDLAHRRYSPNSIGWPRQSRMEFSGFLAASPA